MENELPTGLPGILSRALLSLEGGRQDPSAGEESIGEALEAVREFEEQIPEVRSTDLRDRLAGEVAAARAALEASRADEARNRLLDVGRAMDRHVKEMRG